MCVLPLNHFNFEKTTRVAKQSNFMKIEVNQLKKSRDSVARVHEWYKLNSPVTVCHGISVDACSRAILLTTSVKK